MHHGSFWTILLSSNCEKHHWASHCAPIQNFVSQSSLCVCSFVLLSLSPESLALNEFMFCLLPSLLLFLSPSYLSPESFRYLYRNRSFLRIPLAARPRFSSLRSLRLVPVSCLRQTRRSRGGEERGRKGGWEGEKCFVCLIHELEVYSMWLAVQNSTIPSCNMQIAVFYLLF